MIPKQTIFLSSRCSKLLDTHHCWASRGQAEQRNLAPRNSAWQLNTVWGCCPSFAQVSRISSNEKIRDLSAAHVRHWILLKQQMVEPKNMHVLVVHDASNSRHHLHQHRRYRHDFGYLPNTPKCAPPNESDVDEWEDILKCENHVQEQHCQWKQPMLRIYPSLVCKKLPNLPVAQLSLQQ